MSNFTELNLELSINKSAYVYNQPKDVRSILTVDPNRIQKMIRARYALQNLKQPSTVGMS